MRVEVKIYNRIKKFILKIPVIRTIFLKIESYLFDLFKPLNLRRFFTREVIDLNNPNDKLILKCKKFYEKNFLNENLSAIIEYAEKRVRSAWQGHHYFALWLVNEIKPLVTVDLGVDRGFSSFIFAAQNIGRVYGVDWFMGDSYLGEKEDDYIPVMRRKRKIEKKFSLKNIMIIQSKFTDLAEKWNKPIDILHIDGSHSYDDVKEDYQNWSKFLKEDSVVLFHDVNIYEGVIRFFNELNLPKYCFTHSFGLGVASRNKELISKIEEIWDRVK